MTKFRRFALWAGAGSMLLAIALVLPYWLAGGDTQVLEDSVRATAPGHFLSLPEGKLFYRWDGPEAGKVLLMIHGFSLAHGVFEPNVEALTNQGFRVLRLDNWGRGWSDRPAIAHTAALFDRQLVAALDALGLNGKIDVVGLSMGGAIATVFAAQHPERVKRLALIAPAGLPFARPYSAQLATWPWLGTWIMRVFGKRILLGGEAAANTGVQADALANIKNSLRFPGYLEGLASTLRYYPLNGLERQYARLGTSGLPILLLWGDRDKTVAYSCAARAVELSKGQLVTIKGATHSVNAEQAADVNAALVEFFMRQP
jgi:pimeloyl-ACP methyl ester carboxylesterase